MRSLRYLFLLLIFLPSILFAQTKGSVVTVRENDDADRLNPFTNFSAVGGYVDEYLFFSLMRADMESPEYLPLIAATAPSISDDQLSFMYTIDPAAKFNNGKSISADDVVFSMKVLKNPFLSNQDKMVNYKNVKNVEARGDDKVLIQLYNASPQALRVTGEFAIIPQAVFDPGSSLKKLDFETLNKPQTLDDSQKDLLKAVAEKVNLFGSSEEELDNGALSGPYELSEWKKGDHITLVASKKFWGRKLKRTKNRYFKQNIETIKFLVHTDEGKARELIFNKDVDIDPSLSAPLFFELSEIPKIGNDYRFLTPEGSSYEYVGLNMVGEQYGRPPYLADVKVRRAMAHLVNIDYLLETAQYGFGDRIASDCQSPYDEFRNKELELIQFAPEKAKALLAEAGWTDTDGDGICDKKINGQTVNMELELVYGDNRQIRKMIAKSMKETFEKAGVKIKLSPMAFKESLNQVKAGNFDMMLGAWVSDPNEDSYGQIWHSKNKGGGSNWTGFGDESTDILIELYDSEPDTEKRKRLAHHIQEKIYTAQPYIFLWEPTERIIVSKKFKNAKAFKVRPGFWIPEWVVD